MLNSLTSLFCLLGNLELDLGKLPRPKKEAKKANLAMMNAEDDELMDLFQAKTVKGWWPMKEETEDGTTTIKVNGREVFQLKVISYYLVEKMIRIFS